MRHKAYHREYHEARKHAGGRIDRTDDQCVLVDIVGKFIITAEGYQSAESKTIREKDLRHCVDPYLRINNYTINYIIKIIRINNYTLFMGLFQSQSI